MAPSDRRYYKIRLASGRILGPIDLERIEKLILKNHIKGGEVAREHPGGDWKQVAAFPEIAELLIAKARGRLEAKTRVAAPAYEPIVGSRVDFGGSTQVLPNSMQLAEPSKEEIPKKVELEKASVQVELEQSMPPAAPKPPPLPTAAPPPPPFQIDDEEPTAIAVMKPKEWKAADKNAILPGENARQPELEETGVSSKPPRSRGLADQPTVIFQRSTASKSLPGKPSRKRQKILSYIAIAGALLTVGWDIMFPTPQDKLIQILPLRPRLPAIEEGKGDPNESAKFYQEGMKAYVLDTVVGYKVAAEKLLIAASRDGGNVKALAMLASCYLNLIDSSNKDENYFTVISKLIELSRAKKLDLAETVIADVEFFITVNKPEAAQNRIIDFTKGHAQFGLEMFYYLALAFYSRGDAASAARYITQIPDHKSFSPKIFYLRGLIAEKLGDAREALIEYEKAIKQSPSHAKSRLKIVELLQKQQRIAEAGKHLSYITTHWSLLSAGDLARAYALQSKFYQHREKWEEALASIERSVHLDPENTDYNLEMYMLRAKAGESIPAIQKEARMYFFLGEGQKFLAQGKHQDALIQFLQARQAMPKSTIPLLKIGDMFVYLNDIISARMNYKKAAEASPNNVRIWAKYIDLLIRSYEWEEAEKAIKRFRGLPVPQSSIDKAVADWYAKQGRNQDAQAFYRKAMARDTIDSGVYIAFAKSLMATKNFKDAPFFFALALRFDPLNMEAIIGTAKCIAELEGTDRAIAMLQDELQKQSSSRAELLVAMAEMYMDHSKWEKAEELVQQAIEVNPNYAPSWKLKARLFLNKEGVDKKAVDKALEAYASYSERNASDPSGYLERYRLYARKGLFEAANEELTKIFTIYPRYPNLHYYKGVLYKIQGNYKVAAEELREELKNNSFNVNAMMELGNCLVQLGNPKDALTYFVKAMQIAPESSEPKHMTGYAHYLLKNYPGAIALYNEALKIDRGNPTIYKRLGMAYRDMGDVPNASMMFRKYLEMEPDAIDKDEFQRFL